MLKENGFYRGVNLGGWFSQCDYSTERLDNFITEDDFRTISEWGLDHVRLPVDYNVAELRDDGMERIGKAIRLAGKYGLNVMLDLHKTCGYSFDDGEKESGFFTSREYQERFMRLWEKMAEAFGDDPGHVAFDLLNEITDAEYLPAWKKISSDCIRHIRKYAPDTIILVGSYNYNDVRAIKDLDPPQDARVAYNFHCYEPHFFTHQGAYWNPEFNNDRRVSFEESGVTEEMFENLFESAIEAASARGTDLYCGEYGVIDIVSPDDALRWYKVIHRVLERHGISRAAWSYKEMDFGIQDSRMAAVRSELLRNM